MRAIRVPIPFRPTPRSRVARGARATATCWSSIGIAGCSTNSSAAYPAGGSWNAGSGAIFDLGSNALRPAGWTSADAAGLPIFPGLVRYDEVVEQGEIRHALRFTVHDSRRGYIAPARHFASDDTSPTRPPMGMRVRLKASFDMSGYPPSARVILQALKTYGMIVADNGGTGSCRVRRMPAGTTTS